MAGPAAVDGSRSRQYRRDHRAGYDRERRRRQQRDVRRLQLFSVHVPIDNRAERTLVQLGDEDDNDADRDDDLPVSACRGKVIRERTRLTMSFTLG